MMKSDTNLRIVIKNTFVRCFFWLTYSSHLWSVWDLLWWCVEFFNGKSFDLFTLSLDIFIQIIITVYWNNLRLLYAHVMWVSASFSIVKYCWGDFFFETSSNKNKTRWNDSIYRIHFQGVCYNNKVSDNKMCSLKR